MQHAPVLEIVAVNDRPADGDRQTVERIASGDRHALTELYIRYQRPLFRYLCQLTSDPGLAEEILQDTLVAVWRGAGQFEGRSTVQTWLIGIARRQAHNTLRKRGLPLADLDEVAELADPDPHPEARALATADRAELAAAIARLAPVHRDVLALSFVQGFSYQEIARILNVPEGTVKSRLSNARSALRKALVNSEGGK